MHFMPREAVKPSCDKWSYRIAAISFLRLQSSEDIDMALIVLPIQMAAIVMHCADCDAWLSACMHAGRWGLWCQRRQPGCMCWTPSTRAWALQTIWPGGAPPSWRLVRHSACPAALHVLSTCLAFALSADAALLEPSCVSGSIFANLLVLRSISFAGHDDAVLGACNG